MNDASACREGRMTNRKLPFGQTVFMRLSWSVDVQRPCWYLTTPSVFSLPINHPEMISCFRIPGRNFASWVCPLDLSVLSGALVGGFGCHQVGFNRCLSDILGTPVKRVTRCLWKGTDLEDTSNQPWKPACASVMFIISPSCHHNRRQASSSLSWLTIGNQ